MATLQATSPGAVLVPPSARDTAEIVEDLLARYRRVRAFTHHLCEPLETEDYVVQSMPDASPAKWHLAPGPRPLAIHRTAPGP